MGEAILALVEDPFSRDSRPVAPQSRGGRSRACADLGP